MTWSEYLEYVIGFQEKEGIELQSEPMSAREAQKRIRAARGR